VKAVLDTSVLVEGRFGLDDSFELAVASLSYAELRYGANLPGLKPEERALRLTRIERVEAVFGEGLPFGDAAARSYGIITEVVLKAGRQVRGRAIDLLIAAVAHSVGAGVVTLNPSDFAGLEAVLPILNPEGRPAR
jgi:predicted nucleic acid-binding protein